MQRCFVKGALGLAVVVLGLSSACERKTDGAAERFACSCDFLTDTDKPSVQRVEVCAVNLELARQQAIGCAQSAAPAPIQTCACEPQTKGPSCRAGYCKALERR